MTSEDLLLELKSLITFSEYDRKLRQFNVAIAIFFVGSIRWISWETFTEGGLNSSSKMLLGQDRNLEKHS